jgi:hypothetical protein
VEALLCRYAEPHPGGTSGENFGPVMDRRATAPWRPAHAGALHETGQAVMERVPPVFRKA